VELSGWDAAAVCANVLTYAATLCAAGGIFFIFYSDDLLQDTQHIRVRRLIGVLLAAAVTSSVARILILTGSMSGGVAGMFDAELSGMVLRASEGRASGARIAGLGLAALIMTSSSRFRFTALIGAAIAATSFAWVGHIHAQVPNIAPTTLLCLHLLCIAFWLGALAPLLICGAAGNDARVGAIAARFGKMALGVVAALVTAGGGLLWVLIRNASVFWTSGYARLMLIKLFLVALLLSIAALNKLYLTPKLIVQDGNAIRRLRLSIVVEMLLGGVILLVTAVFTTLTAPP
jgi:copper resistance protein D